MDDMKDETVNAHSRGRQMSGSTAWAIDGAAYRLKRILERKQMEADAAEFDDDIRRVKAASQRRFRAAIIVSFGLRRAIKRMRERRLREDEARAHAQEADEVAVVVTPAVDVTDAATGDNMATSTQAAAGDEDEHEVEVDPLALPEDNEA